MPVKKALSILLLVAIVLTAGSFKSKRKYNQAGYKKDGYFIAVVDGKMFVTRDENRYSAELVNKTTDAFWESMEVKSKLKGVTNSMTFFGNQFFDASANLAEERINFSYTFNDGATGAAANPLILMHYNNDKYYNLPESTTFKITKLMWNQDRRYCVVNAEFDCKMRRWGVPAANQPVVHLKGTMENINITNPSGIYKSPNLEVKGG
jgi:hypothetical protein